MTEMRTWTTIDNKAEWGEGEWADEPDVAAWVDEATGLPCLARRADVGVWCGYVGVPPQHPYHKRSMDQAANLQAHGYPITWASDDLGEDMAALGLPADHWWFAFDCGHKGDYPPYFIHLMRDKESAQLLARGATYRNLDYAREQCALLAAQLGPAPAPKKKGAQRVKSG